MGGSNSSAIDPDFTSVIRQLKYLPVKNVAAILQDRTRQITKERKISFFSKTIMNEAVTDCNLAYNFNLAKLSKFISQEFGDIGAAFKSELIETTSGKIEALLLYNRGVSERVQLVYFAGNLYKVDLVTNRQVYDWVIFLMSCASDQNTLLLNIRDKVEDEYKKPFHDSAVISLRSMLISKGFVVAEKVVVQPEPPAPVSYTLQRIPDFVPSRDPCWQPDSLTQLHPAYVYASSESESDQQEYEDQYEYENEEFDEEEELDEEEEQVEHDNFNDYEETESSSTYSQSNNVRSLPVLFKEYLVTLHNYPHEQFRLKRFKTCTNAERKECARLMLERILIEPKIIVPCAKVTRTIQCSNGPNNHLHANFTVHLYIFCEQEIDRMFKHSSPQWSRVEMLGIFLGELYTRECIRNTTMNQWLDNVKVFVARNNNLAAKALLVVLKIILESMERRNRAAFDSYISMLRTLKPNLVPNVHQSWLQTAMNKHSPQGNSNIAAPSSSGQATGTIRKTQPPVSVQPPVVSQMIVNQKALVKGLKVTNPIEDLQMVLNKLTISNSQVIVAEIVALKIPANEANVRKITNSIVASIKTQPNLVHCVCDILSMLPSQSNPKFDSHIFQNQLMLSVMSQLTYLEQYETLDEQKSQTLVNLVKILLTRKAMSQENVKEIIERLACDARSNEKIPLQLLLIILKTFGCETLGTLGSMVKTEATLIKHLRNSESQKVRKDCDDGLQLLRQAKGVSSKVSSASKVASPAASTPFVPISIEVVKCEAVSSPSTSSCSTDSLAWESIDDLKRLVAAIKTQDQMVQFAKSFYETAMNSEKFLLYVKSAELIENEFDLRRTGKSFKEVFMDTFYKSYKPMPVDQMKESKIIQSLVKFNAELYKIKWISIDELIAVMDMLVFSKSLIETFHILLKTVAMAVINDGHGLKLQKYREIYMKRQESYKKSAKEYTMCLEILEIFKDLVSITAVTSDHNEFDAILGCVNTQNVQEKAQEIVMTCKETRKNLNALVGSLADQVVDNPEQMANLCNHLINNFGDKAEAFNEILMEKCQEMMMTEFSEGKLTSAMNLTMFFADLYTFDILSTDFIILCSDVIWAHESENAVECIAVIVYKIGPKLQNENSEAATKIFESFEEFNQQTQTQSVQDLLHFRKYLQEVQGEEPSSSLFNELTREHLHWVASICDDFIKQSDDLKSLLNVISVAVIANPKKSKLYADLCQAIQDEPFHQRLNDCLQILVIRYEVLKSEVIEGELTTLMIFVAELYVRDVVLEETLLHILKASKHLDFDSLAIISSIVSEKINQSDNMRLKTQLVQLDDSAHEKSMKFLKELKSDLGEICEFIQKTQEPIDCDETIEQSEA